MSEELRGQLRCYHFGNMYLSSMQQGIQAAHAQMEMFVKYEDNPYTNYAGSVDSYLDHCKKREMLYIWATEHKTMICLNAGNNNSLCSLLQLIQRKDNPYAWAAFYESTEALDGLLTNIAIILPESVYNASDEAIIYNQCTEGWDLGLETITQFEYDLIQMKNQYRMAR